jgi:hypothetical protein
VTLEAELGAEIMNKAIAEVVQEFDGASTGDCLKRPALFSKLLEKAKAQGHQSASLNSVVDKIVELSEKHKI